jgi:hypothetical protein
MNKKGMDLDGALDWLAEYHGQILSNFQVQYLIACFLWRLAVGANVSACEEISPLK